LFAEKKGWFVARFIQRNQTQDLREGSMNHSRVRRGLNCGLFCERGREAGQVDAPHGRNDDTES